MIKVTAIPQPTPLSFVLKASETTGVGVHDIKTGMNKWPTRDPLMAAFYMIARSHAIVVKGDRDRRDRLWALEMRGRDL